MVDYYISRVCGNLQLLQQLDLIGRTSEMARLFGIQFLHVLTRGSQVKNFLKCFKSKHAYLPFFIVGMGEMWSVKFSSIFLPS